MGMIRRGGEEGGEPEDVVVPVGNGRAETVGGKVDLQAVVNLEKGFGQLHYCCWVVEVELVFGVEALREC